MVNVGMTMRYRSCSDHIRLRHLWENGVNQMHAAGPAIRPKAATPHDAQALQLATAGRFSPRHTCENRVLRSGRNRKRREIAHAGMIHDLVARRTCRLKIRLEEAELSAGDDHRSRSEEHTYELQSLMRSSYAVFC